MNESRNLGPSTQEATAAPSRLDYAILATSLLLWIAGGVAVAALLSQWESASHGDPQDFAASRLAMNLVFGAVAGLLVGLVRAAKSSRR
jgi:hypothetical protein